MTGTPVATRRRVVLVLVLMLVLVLVLMRALPVLVLALVLALPRASLAPHEPAPVQQMLKTKEKLERYSGGTGSIRSAPAAATACIACTQTCWKESDGGAVRRRRQLR